jgi:hypothetical protein
MGFAVQLLPRQSPLAAPIALKTSRNGGITPQGIAQGKGDAHLIGLGNAIAESGKPTIIRPLAEMNNERNPYCAFYADGRRRGAAITTRWYRKAFQRMYLLLHGGTAQQLTARLRRLGMPGVGTRRTPASRSCSRSGG